MRNLKNLLAAMSLLAMIGGAWAADMDEPVLVDAPDEYQPVEVGSGWYLRGDISYNAADPAYDFTLFGQSSDTQPFGGGIGFGYHFSDNLRADVNFSYLGGESYEYDDGVNFATAEHDVYSIMLAGYWDIATVGGLTPYVGAGIGTTYSSTNVTVDLATLPAPVTYDSSQYNLSYSLMAGASYKLTNETSIDFGYQFIDTPDLEYLNTDTLTLEKGLQQHLVKVGLRYDLW